MNVLALDCPHCGGRLERKKDEYFAKCPYCGSEIAFNDIKEEAQLGAYREKINTLEHNENIDTAKRLSMQKWVLGRNIVFTVMAVFNCIGFLLVGLEKDKERSPLIAVGSVLMLIAFLGWMVGTPFLSATYPGYNALYRKNEKFGKVKMWLKLCALTFAVFIASAFMAYIIMSIIM